MLSPGKRWCNEYLDCYGTWFASGLGGAHLKMSRLPAELPPNHVSHHLNSLKGANIGDYIGDYYRAY